MYNKPIPPDVNLYNEKMMMREIAREKVRLKDELKKLTTIYTMQVDY